MAEPPKAETPAPVAPAPFPVRVNGRRVEIPGLTVAPEHEPAVRSLIVDGLNHRENFPRMQAEWKQKLAAAESLVEAKSGKYNKASVYLFDKLQTLLAENPAELEMTRRELALMLKESDLTIPKPAPASDEAGIDEGAARATLAGYVKELFEDTPDAGKYFTPEDRSDFERHVQELIESLYAEHEGEYMLAEHKVEALFKRELSKLQRAHQAQSTAARDAEKAKAAAAFNAAQKPAVVPPPTPPKPKPALVAAPSGAPRKSWDQRVNDIWTEDDDEE